MAFQEVTEGGKHFKFENPGDSLTGYYLGDDTINVNGKNIIRHSFQVDGEVYTSLSSADLDKKLSKVNPGEMVRLTFKEKKRTKTGGSVKLFKIERNTEDTIPVAAPRKSNTTADAIAQMKGE